MLSPFWLDVLSGREL